MGFYASRPFWAMSKPNFNILAEQGYGDVGRAFTDMMSEQVFVRETNDYSLKICRDGMVLLQIKHLAEETDVEFAAGRVAAMDTIVSRWARYLDCLNTIYLLLDSTVIRETNFGYFHLSEITHRDAFPISLPEGKFTGGSPPQSYSEKYWMGRFLSDYNIPNDGLLPFHYGKIQQLLVDMRMQTREQFQMPENLFVSLARDFEVIYYSPKGVEILAQLTKSLSEYKNGNFATSLILAWFVIELFLKDRWNRFIDSRQSRDDTGELRFYPSENDRPKRQKKIFTKYGIEAISNFLELMEIIPLEVFKKIDVLRGERNKNVHREQTPSTDPTICHSAFEVIQYFVKEDVNIEISLSTGYSTMVP